MQSHILLIRPYPLCNNNLQYSSALHKQDYPVSRIKPCDIWKLVKTSVHFRQLLVPNHVQGFIRPVARVGSGDPVRVLRLYTRITLDEVCSIYCRDICTTCRYQSMCYSTCAPGPTALSVCSLLCPEPDCWLTNWPTDWLRTVLYDAFYSCLCRRYLNGILGPSSPPLPGESFGTCSKAVAFALADTQVF